jgi:drug/metabolite transporter (DMT)-like permease
VSAVLALLSSLLWGAADFLGGTVSRRFHPLAVVGGSQAMGLLGLLVVAALVGELDSGLGYLPWGIAAGLVGLVALASFYTALATGTMGVVAPVAALGVVVPVVVGIVAGESPSAGQLVGIVVAVAGVVLAAGPQASGVAAHGVRNGSPGRRSRSPSPRRSPSPLVLAAVAAVGFGLVLVLVAGGSRHSAVMTLLAMRVSSVSTLAVLALRLRTVGGLRRGQIGVLAAIGAGDTLANAAYAVATHSGLVSVTAVLASLYPAVTVLLAFGVHGERMRPVQNTGVVVTLAGVALIAAGGGAG